ncbi:Aste57867_24315 [Aphanomyces stellatus]|uniref:Aste57867_24315 protein n=1 Tax=Aphanomyces stellatus TaxID=120398 RepID=A0A485LR73_9STRA|nr:hypothetical protein As57867_024240 [Aphanomyces stellatus]VFU00955.1 Aste57867_24315 [Aphanomyces stellatus]
MSEFAYCFFVVISVTALMRPLWLSDVYPVVCYSLALFPWNRRCLFSTFVLLCLHSYLIPCSVAVLSARVAAHQIDLQHLRDSSQGQGDRVLEVESTLRFMLEMVKDLTRRLELVEDGIVHDVAMSQAEGYE